MKPIRLIVNQSPCEDGVQRAISEGRDRLQSRLLVAFAGGGLLLFWAVLALSVCVAAGKHPRDEALFWKSVVMSLTFAGLVWALRAGTPAAAISGALICCQLTFWSTRLNETLLRSELTPLLLLFVLTFLATRIGKRRQSSLTSTREARHGRSAAQVIANLGAAPLALLAELTGAYNFATPLADFSARADSTQIAVTLALAALVEATADTVSSEIGQVFGGVPYLLTTWKPVAAGTDGAISLLGTGAGILAGAMVAGAGAWAMRLSGLQTAAALLGGVAGLLFDSVLGATVERRGWLNNDLVNFSSTIFAALIALGLLLLKTF